MNNIRKNLILFFIFIAISCIISIIYFRLPDFDFYSYHYYNGWAFLNNRINIDFMPCRYRTYFNPFWDALMYLSVEKFNNHPLILILFSGFKYGFLMFVAYKIYDFILKPYQKEKSILIIFCLLFAGFSPIVLYCVNFDNTDIQGAVLILIGFYIFIKNIGGDYSKKRNLLLFTATFFMGLAFGLKYSNLACSFAVVPVSLCLFKKINCPIKTIFILLAGYVCGFLLTGGYWMYLLYEKFQNPFFPYFNNIFRSELYNYDCVLNTDYAQLLPKSFYGFILYPLKNTVITENVGWEKTFYDIKIALTFICTIFMLIIIKYDKCEDYRINKNTLLIVIYYTIFAYYINLALFAAVRYIIPLFIIMPIIICVFIKYITKNKHFYYGLATILFIFCITFVPADTKGSVLYMQKKALEINNLNFEDGSIIICGNACSCFVAPKQNKNVKYVYYYDFLDDSFEKLFNENENIYILYSNIKLDFNKEKQRFKKYLTNIDKCKNINYKEFGYLPIATSLEFKVCKIK